MEVGLPTYPRLEVQSGTPRFALRDVPAYASNTSTVAPSCLGKTGLRT